MAGYDLSINIKSASDTGAVTAVDAALERLEQNTNNLNQRLASTGQGAQQVAGNLQGLGAASAEADIRMAAARARARDLDSTLRDLGQKVASGQLTVEQATDAWDQYNAQLADIGPAARTAGDAVEKAGQGAQTTSLKWANIAGALYTVRTAYQAVQRGAEMLYQTVREGAELDWGERRFENLVRSIGSTSGELLGAMERTTQGMLSQAETMGMAADLIGLKLVGSVEEASRLAGVVAGLGMDLNQLTLTLTNQTTMRFDQLGVAVGGFEEKLKRLEAQGLSTDKAFLWAFIEQAEESMARSGSRADTLAGKLDVLEASWANLRAEMLQEIVARVDVEGVEEAADSIVTLTGKVTTLATWIEKIASISPPAWPNWFAKLLTAGAGVVTAPENQGMSERERAAWAESQREAESASTAQEQRNRNLERNANIWRAQSEAERAAYYRAVREAAGADQVLMQQQATWRAQQSQRFEEETEAVWNYHAALRAVTQSDREMTYTTDAAVEAGKKNAENYTEQAIRARELEELKQQLLVSDREFTYTTQANVSAGMEAAAAYGEQRTAAEELDAAIKALDETTAGYFDTIRKGGELDYDEIFYEATRAAGADERAIADLMVAQGKWTQAQADAKVAQAELGAQTEILGATWQAAGLSAEGAILAQQYLTTGMYDSAEAAIRAAKYGSVMAGTLETEVSPALRTGRDAAQEYGGALGGIPEDVTTEIETPGLPEATTNAIDYYTELGFIPDFVETEVRTPGMSSAIEDASTLDGYLRGIPAEVTSTIRVVTFASGGAYDPGLGTYVPPSSGGGNPSTPPGAAGSFAGGTSGWLEMPGPRGKSYLIEVHGGEGLNVNPDGIPAGGEGNTYNTYHNQISIVVEGRRSDLPTGEATPFLDAIRALGFTV